MYCGLEVPGQWPFHESAWRKVYFRPWLRLQDVPRGSRAPIADPVLLSAKSLWRFDHDRGLLADGTRANKVFWICKKSGRPPRSRRHLHANAGIAAYRPHGRDSDEHDETASQTDDRGAVSDEVAEGGAEDHPGSSESDNDNRIHQRHTTGTHSASGSLARSIRRGRAHPLAQALPLQTCRVAYDGFTDETKQWMWPEPQDRPTNPFVQHGPEDYEAALEESRQQLVEAVTDLARQPSLTPELILERLSETLGEIATIYPPLVLANVHWPADGETFEVPTRFSEAMRTLQRRLLQLSADPTLMDRYSVRIPICRLETLMLIQVSQLEEAAAVAMGQSRRAEWQRIENMPAGGRGSRQRGRGRGTRRTGGGRRYGPENTGTLSRQHREPSGRPRSVRNSTTEPMVPGDEEQDPLDFLVSREASPNVEALLRDRVDTQRQISIALSAPHLSSSDDEDVVEVGYENIGGFGSGSDLGPFNTTSDAGGSSRPSSVVPDAQYSIEAQLPRYAGTRELSECSTEIAEGDVEAHIEAMERMRWAGLTLYLAAGFS